MHYGVLRNDIATGYRHNYCTDVSRFGELVMGLWQAFMPLCRHYTCQLVKVFGVDVESDDPGVHPTHFCHLFQLDSQYLTAGRSTAPRYFPLTGVNTLKVDAKSVTTTQRW